MRSFLTALFLFCSSFTYLTAESTAHWIEVRSTHFTVLTDSNEKQARRLARQFEQMRSVFHILIPNATADSGAPIIVLALKDTKGFQALEPAEYLAKGQLNLAGLFMQSPEKNYILVRLNTEDKHPFATVYHEYTHLMTSNAVWMPLWLNEGLAEFYQNTDIYDKEVVLGQPSLDDILFLRENRLIPLTTLLQVDHKSPYYHDEQKGSVFYAESWALTHYIEVTDRQRNTNRMGDYAKFLLQHEDPVTAAQHAFGDLKQLQKDLNDYVTHADFKQFQMKSSVEIDESSFQARVVPTPEADAVRADVLVYNGRTKEAEALLATSLRDDPQNAQAHATMGFLKFRENDLEGAKKWFGEAVQLDSTSYLANYYYASMLLQTNDTDHDAAIEGSLRASIKSRPDFAPAYDALAHLYDARHEKLDESHLLSTQAIQLEPGNFRYRLNSVNVLLEKQDFESALRVLKLAANLAKTPGESAIVQAQIEQIEQYQASVNEAQRAPGHTMARMTEAPGAVSGPKTTTFERVDGKMMGVTRIGKGSKYPEGDSTGAHHVVSGVIRNVQCSEPSVLALSLDESGKEIALYNNNFYKIEFTTANYEPKGDILPCTDIEGMKARVGYAEVSNANVDGQIISIELSK